MNNSLKKLSIFSLAAGVGQMIHDQTDDDKIKWRSSLLARSGNEALATCKAKIDTSRLNQVKKKIDAVCEDKEKFDTVNMLSFLLTGLDDLQAHCKRKSEINSCIKRANWLLEFFDPKLENTDLFKTANKQYLEWVK